MVVVGMIGIGRVQGIAGGDGTGVAGSEMDRCGREGLCDDFHIGTNKATKAKEEMTAAVRAKKSACQRKG